MQKKEFIEYLIKVNNKSFTQEELSKISGWTILKTIKFLNNFHSLKPKLKNKFKIESIFLDDKGVVLSGILKTHQSKTIELKLINLEFLTEERKTDLLIAKNLFNKNYSWKRTKNTSKLMNNNEELPFFSSNLNDSLIAIKKLNNLFFTQQIEQVNKMTIFECLTYNDYNKSDQVFVKANTMAMAVSFCILKYLKNNP